MTGSDADGDDDELDEPTDNDMASGDFVWDYQESEALWRALMDAKLVAWADTMRAFLQQVDNEVRLSATEEVELTSADRSGPARLRGCWPNSPSAVRCCLTRSTMS